MPKESSEESNSRHLLEDRDGTSLPFIIEELNGYDLHLLGDISDPDNTDRIIGQMEDSLEYIGSDLQVFVLTPPVVEKKSVVRLRVPQASVLNYLSIPDDEASFDSSSGFINAASISGERVITLIHEGKPIDLRGMIYYLFYDGRCVFLTESVNLVFTFQIN